MQIITKYDPTPIPIRDFDWCAHDDDYEPGLPIGWGATEAEAIADFRREIEESAT